MLHIDKSKHQIWYYNRPLTLSTKEYQALLLLAEHGEQVTSREALMQHVWKTQHKSDSVVTQLLSQLKKN